MSNYKILILLTLVFILIFGISSLVSANPQSYDDNNNICACYVSVEECGWTINPFHLPPFRDCKNVEFKLRVGETVQCGKNINSAEYYDCVIEKGKFVVKRTSDGELISNKEEGYVGNGKYEFNVDDISVCTKKRLDGEGVLEPLRTECIENRNIDESDYYRTARKILTRKESSGERSSDSKCCKISISEWADGIDEDVDLSLLNKRYKKGSIITYNFRIEENVLSSSRWERAETFRGNSPYPTEVECVGGGIVIPNEDSLLKGFKRTYGAFNNVNGIYNAIEDKQKRIFINDLKVNGELCESSSNSFPPPQESDDSSPDTSNTESNNNDAETSSNDNNNEADDLACGCAVKINNDVWVSDENREFVKGKKIKRGFSVIYNYGVDVYTNEREALSPDLPRVKPIKRITELEREVCQGNQDIIIPPDERINSLVSSEVDSEENILKTVIFKYGNARPFLLDVEIKDEDLCENEIALESQNSVVAPEFNIFTIIIALLVSLLIISVIRVRKTKQSD